MIMFMEILGKDFIVWDKGAEIKFIKPGISTLHVDFELSPELVKDVRNKAIQDGSYVFDITVNIKNESDVVHAQVKKIMYVATKAHYLERQALKNMPK